MTTYLYQVQDKGHLATETVKVRKAPADASKAKPFRFVPLASNGTDRCKVARYTLTDSIAAEWLALTDSKARGKLLAAVEPLIAASNISPTVSQLASMRALVGREELAVMLAAGTLLVPSDRAERAAGTSAETRKMTEAERTAAALDALFAEPEAEPTDEDGTDEGEPSEGDEPNADGASEGDTPASDEPTEPAA